MKRERDLLSRSAALGACLVLALSCVAGPAQAQRQPYVNPVDGQGTHLLFPYWSTADATNTNVHLQLPRGVMDEASMEKEVVVKVAVRDAMNKVVASLKICLLPADSWTATLSEGGLTVVDPGACDAKVALDPPTRDAPMQSTPEPGEMVSLGGVSSGWLDAWVAPTKGLVDGPDADTDPDNATRAVLLGGATLISATSGFSSSYLPAPLILCGRGAGGTNVGAIPAAGDDGDGCWTTQNDGNASQKKENGEAIRLALTSGRHNQALANGTKVFHTGRWTALDDANVRSRTTLVLTLPVNHLAYTGTNAGEKVAGTDPVSLLVFDGQGQLGLEAREVLLDKHVNTCRFLPAAMAQEVEVGAGEQTVLSCNGVKVGGLVASSGTFRLFNNTKDEKGGGEADAEEVTNTGVEAKGLGRSFDPVDDTTQNGQSLAETLGVVGLNFSYFRGTDGQEYDQVTVIQKNYAANGDQL